MQLDSAFGCEVSAVVERAAPADAGGGVGLRGRFKFECYGPDGALKWEDETSNTVFNLGLDSFLNVYLVAATQITTWYAGLIDNSGFTALAAADTISSHSGWSECSSYSESVRQTWTPGSSSGQSVSNGTAMTYSINATVTIRGAFLASNSTKGGTSGLLHSGTALTGGTQSCNSGDTLKVTYTCSASSL